MLSLHNETQPEAVPQNRITQRSPNDLKPLFTIHYDFKEPLHAHKAKRYRVMKLSMININLFMQYPNN